MIGSPKYDTETYDDIYSIEFSDDVRWNHLKRYGNVALIISLAPGGVPIVVGNEGTWVEYGGRRYSTYEDYQELKRVVDNEKIKRLLEKL